MSRTNWNFARARQNAWGAAELCSARTIAGRFGNPPRVSITIVGSRRALLGADHRGKVWKPSQGFHHNRGEPPSFARRGPSREGLETLPGFPSQSWGAAELCSARTIAGRFGNPPRVSITIVGSRRALLGADHRGKVWKPSQGFHHNRGEPPSFARRGPSREGLETLPGFPSQSWGAAELCSARTIAGRFGNPPRVSITIVGSRRALLGADHRARPSVARGRQGGWQVPRVWKPFQGFHHNCARTRGIDHPLRARETALR